jgi:hypothetical protein
MKWFDDITMLQYYNQTPGVDCYCDLLVEAGDLTLQAQVAPAPSGQYVVKVEVLQPDGMVVFEDATQYFEWYAFQGVNGSYYVNIRALRFSPAMCVNPCFILRVTISRVELLGLSVINRVIFQKYTERYCVDNCCIVATDIEITQVSETEGEYSISEYDNDEYLT